MSQDLSPRRTALMQLSARCLLLTFGDHLWFMTEKLLIPFFFFAHKALHFFLNERFLDSSTYNFGLRLTTEYFRRRGRGGNLMTVQGDVSRKNSVTSRRTPLSERLKHAG